MRHRSSDSIPGAHDIIPSCALLWNGPRGHRSNPDSLYSGLGIFLQVVTPLHPHTLDRLLAALGCPASILLNIHPSPIRYSLVGQLMEVLRSLLLRVSMWTNRPIECLFPSRNLNFNQEKNRTKKGRGLFSEPQHSGATEQFLPSRLPWFMSISKLASSVSHWFYK